MHARTHDHTATRAHAHRYARALVEGNKFRTPRDGGHDDKARLKPAMISRIVSRITAYY